MHVLVFARPIAFYRDVRRTVRSSERPATGGADSSDAGQSCETPLHVLEESEAAFRCVAAQLRIDREARKMFGLKPRIFGEQVKEADAKESRPCQQQKREGELAGHEDLTPARVRKP